MSWAARAVLCFVAVFAVVGVGGQSRSAFAAEREPFSNERFEELKADGTPFLVVFYAPWCSTCRRQEQILTSLRKEAEFSKVRELGVNWDEGVEHRAPFSISRRSTIVAFRGPTEVGRIVASTKEGEIRELLKRAVAEGS